MNFLASFTDHFTHDTEGGGGRGGEGMERTIALNGSFPATSLGTMMGSGLSYTSPLGHRSSVASYSSDRNLASSSSSSSPVPSSLSLSPTPSSLLHSIVSTTLSHLEGTNSTHYSFLPSISSPNLTLSFSQPSPSSLASSPLVDSPTATSTSSFSSSSPSSRLLSALIHTLHNVTLSTPSSPIPPYSITPPIVPSFHSLPSPSPLMYGSISPVLNETTTGSESHSLLPLLTTSSTPYSLLNPILSTIASSALPLTQGPVLHTESPSPDTMEMFEIGSGNFSVSDNLIPRPSLSMTWMICLSVILGLLIMATILGNVCVILAIKIDRNLRSLQNNLIYSLAIADLLVATCVMPFAAIYEVSGKWIMGRLICDLWTSADVLCCTSSILHLVAIALDRYWAVTNIDYSHSRTPAKIKVLLGCVWVVSIVVSLVPHFGWKDADYETRILNQECLLSQDVRYQVLAMLLTFYGPLAFILFLYGRIFQVARRRIRNKPGASSAVKPVPARPQPVTLQMEEPRGSDSKTSPEIAPEIITPEPNTEDIKAAQKKVDLRREKERKTAKTLAIITGVFIVCWLPFFSYTLLTSLTDIPAEDNFLSSVFLWLGYVNSLLNPVIYTIFSPDFRNSFKKLLPCNSRDPMGANSIRR